MLQAQHSQLRHAVESPDFLQPIGEQFELPEVVQVLQALNPYNLVPREVELPKPFDSPQILYPSGAHPTQLQLVDFAQVLLGCGRADCLLRQLAANHYGPTTRGHSRPRPRADRRSRSRGQPPLPIFLLQQLVDGIWTNCDLPVAATWSSCQCRHGRRLGTRFRT